MSLSQLHTQFPQWEIENVLSVNSLELLAVERRHCFPKKLDVDQIPYQRNGLTCQSSCK